MLLCLTSPDRHLKGYEIAVSSPHSTQSQPEEMSVLLKPQNFCFQTEEMVGKDAVHIPTSACKMPQLRAPSLPADHGCHRKTSCQPSDVGKRTRVCCVRAKGTPFGLACA